MKYEKTEIFLRELVLFTSCIIYLPLCTLRILAFKWINWIRKEEAIIQKDNQKWINAQK